MPNDRSPNRSVSPRSDSRSLSPVHRSRSPPRHRSYSPEERDGGRRAGGARGPKNEDGLCFSDYYRSRFGSHSPQEYQNLRVTNIDPKVSNEDLIDTLEKMKKYGDLHVKIVNQRDPYGRIAYVNFDRAEDAKDARNGYLQKMVAVLGKHLCVDPAGVVRDQEGRLISNDGGGASGPPRAYQSPRGYYDRGGGGGGRGGGGYRGGGGGGYRGGGDRDRGYGYDNDYRSGRR